MEVFFENRFVNIGLEPGPGMLVQYWRTEGMTEADYRLAMLKVGEFGEKQHNLRCGLTFTGLKFYISPELQAWTRDNVIIPGLQNPFERLAVVVPAEVAEQTAAVFQSVEAMMDQAAPLYKTQYFTDEAQARAWLLS
ncbi:MAG: STAS/SEC14 domain-containing protein [Bernardetiaceae bacterium]|jgi:hypothetical protein|nr:STAS/SEC14 domain-containing protein [Bernardetiaceae bacterium]